VASTAAQSTAPVASRAPISLSWAVWVSGPVDNENLVRRTIKERYNIDLQMLAFERATWQDQINTRVGGGDIPDIIYRDQNSLVTQYVDQGIVAEMTYDAIKQGAPKTFAAANKFSTDSWLASLSGGKNYGIPIMQPAQLYPITDGWRQDWLDKVGVTKAPETLAEFEDAFTKFVKNDPDGNGSADTLAMTGRGKDALLRGFESFFMAYGTSPSQWMETGNGQVQFGLVNEGAKQTLTLLQKWFKAGLIDPEFATVDYNAQKAKWVNSKIGYIQSTWGRLIPTGDHYDPLKVVSPAANIAMANAPKGPDGKFGYINFGPVTSSITFSKKLTGDRLSRALELVEGLTTDQDFATVARYGKEGEHWQRDPQTNAIVPTAAFAKTESKGPLGINFLAAIPPSPDIQAFWARKDEAQLHAKAEAGNVKNFSPFAALLVPSSVSRQTTNLETIQNQWIADFITGSKSLDQWGAFIKEWEAEGGTLRTEATNESYKKLAAERERIKAAVSK
jgi:putative aldouronate transport system substrate-binding protein